MAAMAQAKFAPSASSGRAALAPRSMRGLRALPARQSSLQQRRARGVVTVRAEDGGFDVEAAKANLEVAKANYQKVTNSIPPVATAATVPVIGLSLLCKAITGSGLPGTFLGSIEGLSYLLFIAGAGSFAPRAINIVKGGDFSTEGMLAILNEPIVAGDSIDPNDDVRGKSSTERVANMSQRSGDKMLQAQMADIEKYKQEKAEESEEVKAMKEKLRQSLLQKREIVDSPLGEEAPKAEAEAPKAEVEAPKADAEACKAEADSKEEEEPKTEEEPKAEKVKVEPAAAKAEE